MRKKFLLPLLIITLVVLCISCGMKDKSISEYEWTLERAFYVESEQIVVEALQEPSSTHPEAKVINVTLIAKDGTIVITDHTNNISYEGTYTAVGKNPSGTEYEITIGDVSGKATVAMTTYADGSQIPTLPITLDKYTLQFYSK